MFSISARDVFGGGGRTKVGRFAIATDGIVNTADERRYFYVLKKALRAHANRIDRVSGYPIV
jgi:hypothetical protein